MVHSGLVAHYILTYGSVEQKRRWLPGMASGAIVGAIAMTEPGAGSDLKALRTTAVRDGDNYVVNGAKPSSPMASTVMQHATSSRVVRMTWTPLSQRSGAREPDGPFEGVPEHLRGVLQRWAEDTAMRFGDSTLQEIVLRVRIPAAVVGKKIGAFEVTLEAFGAGEMMALDFVDALLHHSARLEPDAWVTDDQLSALRVILMDGGSIWTASPEGDRLVLVVDEHVETVYKEAVSVQDEAAGELKEAWANAYGRNGDASDAWDHAIKAVEDVLIPVVVPNKAIASLGDVIGQLGSQQSSAAWKMMLPGRDQTHDVEALVGMLRWLWPNHDRHGGKGPRRTPSIQEARMVVTCAAMIVQWHRQGWIVAKR